MKQISAVCMACCLAGALASGPARAAHPIARVGDLLDQAAAGNVGAIKTLTAGGRMAGPVSHGTSG